MSKILVVEDNEASRYVNARVLRAAGFDVLEAATGHEALAMMSEKPDLLLLDVHLPDMNGLQVCRAVKADPATAVVPVLHLTATYGAAHEQAAALEGGADAYLTHPVEPIVLVATIRSLLRAREAEIRAHRLTSWWQSTFDAIQDGVALLDTQGAVLRSNAALRDVEAALFPEGVVTAGPFREALVTRQRASAELALGDRWYEVVADPVLDPDGTVSAVVRTVKDVTGRRLADAQLAELFQREQIARAEAEKGNRLKDEFLATLSHELRTPLNAIVGWVHLLGSGALDEDLTRQAIEAISRNARQQSQLISDILDVSRIVEGKLRLDPRIVDLRSVVSEALQTIRPAAAAKEIVLATRLDRPAPLDCDPDRIQQVVWNLLSNAVKFTPRGGRIEVDLEPADSGVAVRVADSGPGIEAAFLPHVFERFRQADASSTRTHTGLGLGLAIARHLVELHGGTIAVRNHADRSGCVFEVWLPYASARPSPQLLGVGVTPTAAPVATPASIEGVDVLVVDDDRDARDLMTLMLERAGARVRTAASAAEGLAAFDTRSPEVLLADVEMPETDGYELVRRVRARGPEKGGQVPAAAITSYARPIDRSRALAAGFQDHMSKPVDPAALVELVARLRSGTRTD